MKLQYFLASCLAVLILLASSCEEIPPVLNPNDGNGGDTETPVDMQMRQVLIEEFTGVRCVNCPAGSEAIEVLLGQHGQQLVAVSIHAGFFATPYAESNEDLSNNQGESIMSLVSEPIGFPTAVVNRKLFDGEEGRQIGQGQWAGKIAEELIGDPTVRIDIQNTFNDGDRTLTADIDLYVVEDVVAEDLRLSVYLTENNISDYQQTPSGVQSDYTHKHVFREALTAVEGDQLSESFTAGAVVSRTLTFTLPANYNANECEVVAFVHQGGGTLDVIQAHQAHVVE